MKTSSSRSAKVINALRTVLLPALLCAVIFALGFFMPVLYERTAQDFKNEPQTISVAGAESPLYIEGGATVLLPPWDIIGDSEGVSLSNLPPSDDEIYLGINHYVTNMIRPFAPYGASGLPVSGTDFVPALHMYNDRLFFLRDFHYTSEGGGEYVLNLVFTAEFFHPLYVHVYPASDPSPVADENALLRDLEATRDLFLLYQKEIENAVGIAMDDAEGFLKNLLDSAESTYPDTYVPSLTEAFLFFLNPYNTYDNTGTWSVSYDYCYAWQELLWNMQDSYTLTYENETLLVMTDSQNYPYTLFFDGTSQHITGFSLDAALFGYSYPSPTEEDALDGERAP